MRHICLLLLVLSAACQSESRRLLIVDLTLADPLTLDATAAPWHAAGYRVEYRRFYPHLTRLDLRRYRTLLVLGGREPDGISESLTIGDLAILGEWIRRDGVVVLAYNDGAADRWVMNQWLAHQGAGITIRSSGGAGEPQSIDATPLPHSALDNAGFAPFPAGRNRPLDVRDRSQTLARGSTNALVAASRIAGGAGGGLIVVASRSLLGSGDADPGTRDFLVALARWTRRPAEWASIAAATRPGPLRLASAPQQVRVHPPPLAPPAGAAAEELPEAFTEKRDTAPVVVPAWIARQGMRVLWSRFTLVSLDSLLRFVDVAALNALATTIPVPALVDTVSTRTLWKLTGDRLQVTSLRWFPAVALADIPAPDRSADEVDRHGQLTAIPCGLDSLYWRGAGSAGGARGGSGGTAGGGVGLRVVLRSMIRLNGVRPDVIAGVALDLDTVMTRYAISGFCDADYRVGLAGLGLERADVERLTALPPTSRYDTLLERGWLSQYYQTLEDAVAERAVVLRGELRRVHADLRFAIHANDVPTDWFSIGLLRGLSSRDTPVLLWLQERRGHPGQELLREYRGRGVYAIAALRLSPERFALAPPSGGGRATASPGGGGGAAAAVAAELAPLRYAVFTDHAGFWLDRTATDSLGRMLRRFAKEALPGAPIAR
ncbi:MAG TPA: hypothetical protein VKQ05_08580 [Gemmatimonadales bacterium]|nr:hypothetical protein [Gemmatimonadales bacterium]